MAVTDLDAQKVLANGIGPMRQAATAQMSTTAGKSVILHVRNTSGSSVTLSITPPGVDSDGLGMATIACVVPVGADRFVAMAPRLSDPVNSLVALGFTGDLTGVDVCVLDRPVAQ